MVSVILDCKIEMPYYDDSMEAAIVEEIEKELKIISQSLSMKASDIIKKRNKFKVFKGV